MTKIRAILFDMDGVLVHAKDWHYESLNLALEDVGYHPISREDHLAYYDGLPTRKKLERLAKEQHIPQRAIEEINRTKQVYTLQHIEERCVPNPRHLEALKKLKDDGYRMGLCSNSVRETVELIVTKTQLGPYLEFTLSYEDVARPKPDPAMYIEAMRRLGAMPKETLVLEDNTNGIEAARVAGAHVMVITSVTEVTYARIGDFIRTLESAAV